MKYLYYSVLSLLFCGLFALQTTAQSATMTFMPSQDNSLYEEASGEGTVSNGQGKHLYAVRTNQGLARRGLLQFDLSAISSDAAIESVELILNVTKTRGGEQDISLHRVLTAWGEAESVAPGEGGEGAPAQGGDATWVHAMSPDVFWNTPGGDFVEGASATSSVNLLENVSWSGDGLVKDVQSWIENPDQNFGWAIVTEELVNRQSKRFSSREGNNPPILMVTYAPPIESDNIDLELSLRTENEELAKFTPQPMSLQLSNTSSTEATGVTVSLPLPSGQVVVVGGTTPEVSQGSYNVFDGAWEVGTLGAGESATLDIMLFPLSDDYVPYAQVTTADQMDSDSSPNNGVCCYENEDDEASLLGMAEPTCMLLDVIDLPEDVCALCIDEISVFMWNDELYVVELNGPINECSDGLTRVIDCEGNEVCRDGGFAGFRECERMGFYEEAVKVETLAACNIRQNVDLSLSVSTTNPDISQWQSGSFTLNISNTSGNEATGVRVELLLNSDEVVQVGGSETRTSSGKYANGVWSDITIPAGGRAVLNIDLFSKVSNMQFYAQVTAADQDDFDSTPNNGACCEANEDDEVVFRSGNAGNNNLAITGTAQATSSIYPNPVQDVLHITTAQEAAAYQILDLTGKVVQAGQLNYSTTLSLQDLASGMYILKIENETPTRLVKQ